MQICAYCSEDCGNLHIRFSTLVLETAIQDPPVHKMRASKHPINNQETCNIVSLQVPTTRQILCSYLINQELLQKLQGKYMQASRVHNMKIKGYLRHGKNWYERYTCKN